MSADYPPANPNDPSGPPLMSSAGWGPPPGVTLDGEIVDAEVIEDDDLLTPAELAARDLPLMAASLAGADRLPDRLAEDGSLAIEWFRDPDAVQTLARDAQGALLARISELAADARARRPEGPPTSSVLAPELNLLGDAIDTLTAVQGIFGAGVKHAKVLVGEVAHELADDPRQGTTTVRVGDSHGTDLKVTRTQPTKPRIDEDELVDVFVGLLCHRYARVQYKGQHTEASTDGIRGFAQGARAAIELYRQQAAAHTFKTSSLDELTRELEGEGQDALAIRLGHAYGRVPEGDPTVKVERAQRKGKAVSDG